MTSCNNDNICQQPKVKEKGKGLKGLERAHAFARFLFARNCEMLGALLAQNRPSFT